MTPFLSTQLYTKTPFSTNTLSGFESREINVLPFPTHSITWRNKISVVLFRHKKLFSAYDFQCMCLKNDNGECLMQGIVPYWWIVKRKLAHVSLDRENTYEDLNYTFLLSILFCYKSSQFMPLPYPVPLGLPCISLTATRAPDMYHSCLQTNQHQVQALVLNSMIFCNSEEFPSDSLSLLSDFLWVLG